ncbi:hypothetical protein MRX96_053592 [Rhipicephalus microplus]
MAAIAWDGKQRHPKEPFVIPRGGDSELDPPFSSHSSYTRPEVERHFNPIHHDAATTNFWTDVSLFRAREGGGGQRPTEPRTRTTYARTSSATCRRRVVCKSAYALRTEGSGERPGR